MTKQLFQVFNKNHLYEKLILDHTFLKIWILHLVLNM